MQGFTPAACEVLLRHDWPGNVRQLANEVERALLLGDGDMVELDDLRTHEAGRA
jgi:DNA-binding NtrC family response regulator